MATAQAYHAPHSLACTIDVLDGHIGHPFENLGIAGAGLYTSTWEPPIGVRSPGLLKYSAASAVMAAVARNRRLRHRAVVGAVPRRLVQLGLDLQNPSFRR
jgi:hypothetical protein